jgi:galactitol PTS system EIIB component
MARKRVLVVCGTGIATSTVVAHKIGEFLKERGIDAEIRQAKVMEMGPQLADIDLVVAITLMPRAIDKPVVNGMPFITGANLPATLEEIAKHLST